VRAEIIDTAITMAVALLSLNRAGAILSGSRGRRKAVIRSSRLNAASAAEAEI
jgi:hypothetical protein